MNHLIATNNEIVKLFFRNSKNVFMIFVDHDFAVNSCQVMVCMLVHAGMQVLKLKIFVCCLTFAWLHVLVSCA